MGTPTIFPEPQHTELAEISVHNAAKLCGLDLHDREFHEAEKVSAFVEHMVRIFALHRAEISMNLMEITRLMNLVSAQITTTQANTHGSC